MTNQAEFSKSYEPSEIEESIYRLWTESGAFHAVPDDRPREQRYVIMMPLPNITGALHMGHAIDNVMQDLLIRWNRMQGKNTLWMPGTDHASIATQAVVEKRLLELEGLTRRDVGREGLLQRIWEWKGTFQNRIISQLQRIGCSCDWERMRFTMDPVCGRAVRTWFFKMFADGLIFRGKRLVNWDTYLQTTISDDEIYHETVDGHFWHLRYPILDAKPGEPDSVSVATTRPETMLGDTAVAVHPNPRQAFAAKIEALEGELSKASAKERPELEAQLEALRTRERELLPRLEQLRDMALEGRTVALPLLDRPIPLICDEWAKPELGSGCVKITPAHDHNDYSVWTRHQDQIGIINILNDNGTLNENAGPYAGLDRFVARDKVVEDLQALGLVDTIEDRQVEIGHSDRSKTAVEPYLSDQWYIRMGDVEGGVVLGRGSGRETTSPGLVQAAMDAVIHGRVTFHPERYTRTYLDWLAEKRDWPISRQLWWGHRIPIWAKQVRYADLDLSELAPIHDERVTLRVHLMGEQRSVLIDGSLSFSEPGLGDDDLCLIDICLLGDDPEKVEALEQLGYVQDPDVLDTWFSSALWPFSTLGWPDPATAEVDSGQALLGAQGDVSDCLSYYYPGNCLVTARDIITLWVARMVLAGLYNLNEIPFTDVFIHANILDGKGERMNKSKGNGIDPVDIIENYGTDAMRYVLCEMQTGSQDIRLPVKVICPVCGFHNELAVTEHGKSLFTYVCGKRAAGQFEKGSCHAEFDVLGTMPDLPAAKPTSDRFETGRAFCIKLWNSFRFAVMNLDNLPRGPIEIEELQLEDRWILDGLSQCIRGVQEKLTQYGPSQALGVARDFFWSALCDWYLELIKPRLRDPDSETRGVAQQVLALVLDQVLRLFHPFVPYITEHLWQKLGEKVPLRGLGDLWPAEVTELLILAPWPRENPTLESPETRALFAQLQEITRALREVRGARNIPPSQSISVTLKPPVGLDIDEGLHVLTHLAAIESLKIDPEARRTPGTAVKVMGELQLFVHDVMDDELERARLRKALAKIEKEIDGCQKKLTNPKFVERAPAEVIQEQRDRLEGFSANRDGILANLEELAEG